MSKRKEPSSPAPDGGGGGGGRDEPIDVDDLSDDSSGPESPPPLHIPREEGDEVVDLTHPLGGGSSRGRKKQTATAPKPSAAASVTRPVKRRKPTQRYEPPPPQRLFVPSAARLAAHLHSLNPRTRLIPDLDNIIVQYIGDLLRTPSEKLALPRSCALWSDGGRVRVDRARAAALQWLKRANGVALDPDRRVALTPPRGSFVHLQTEPKFARAMRSISMAVQFTADSHAQVDVLLSSGEAIARGRPLARNGLSWVSAVPGQKMGVHTDTRAALIDLAIDEQSCTATLSVDGQVVAILQSDKLPRCCLAVCADAGVQLSLL
jgi:hypothetical protein